MTGTDVESIISIILLLLFIAIFAGILFRKIKVPYTIGLFLAGFVITAISRNISGIENLFDFVLSSEIILFLFLPPIVFEAAFHINKRLMSETIAPILILAIPGVIFSALVVGCIVGYATPVPLIYAMLFGALISATDPVSVIALFKNIGVPARLTTILEGESVFNDASALVTFSLVLGIISVGTFDLYTVVYGTEWIFWSFFGGILTGIFTGILIGSLIALSGKDAVISSVITMIIAYASYLLADSLFQVSGIIAVLTAGLIVGWFSSIWLKKEERKGLSDFQDFSAYLANSLIFLLIGITTANILAVYSSETELLLLIPVALVAVFISRAAVVYILSGVMNLFKGRGYIPLNYQHALFWGGLRGAVALALALSISENMPYRDEIVMMTVGVVLFTVIVEGTTTKPLTAKLGLDRPSNIALYEYYSGIIHAKTAGLKILDRLEARNKVEPVIAGRIRDEYSREITDARSGIQEIYQNILPDDEVLKKFLWIRLIMVERSFYEEFYEGGYISEIVLDEMRHFINLRLDDVMAGIVPPRDILKPDSPEYRISMKTAAVLSGTFKNSHFAKNLRKFILTTEYQKYIVLSSAATEVEGAMDIITSELDFPEKIVDEAGKELHRISERSEKRIEDMSARYPELSKDIEDYYFRLSIMMKEEKEYSGMKEKGLVFPNVYHKLLEKIEKERAGLEEHIFNIV
ncbi:cation:proton antiporter [Methanolacinia paynteri]|uniref:cation:proton antiporter n=1 Tax=Methanolacinia paynteri TaxID=230356 RepID=UPI00064F5A30|nr:sodium:proton antiporter [Methanolacinia paynteri]